MIAHYVQNILDRLGKVGTEILALTEISQPEEVTDPWLDYNGHLLRCRADRAEYCNESVVIYAPNQKEPVNMPLPADVQSRRDMRLKWFGWCRSGDFVEIIMRARADDVGVSPAWRLYQIFPKNPDDIQAVADFAIAVASESLPDFEAIAAVAHVGEFVESDKVSVLAPHIHILLRRNKNDMYEDFDCTFRG